MQSLWWTPTQTSSPGLLSQRTLNRWSDSRCASWTLRMQSRAPGINLLDASNLFADRDRTADSVVRVASGPLGAMGTADAVDP